MDATRSAPGNLNPSKSNSPNLKEAQRTSSLLGDRHKRKDDEVIKRLFENSSPKIQKDFADKHGVPGKK